jgi:TolB-like protein
MLAAGCSSHVERQYVQRSRITGAKRYAAVLPLVNLTPHPDAGRVVGDLLATEFYAASSFRFLERTELAQRLSGDRDLEQAMDKAVARRVGEELGVDTVVYGSVGEYGYMRGVDQGPAVSVSLRMLDVPSGQVIWAASRSRSGGCFAVCAESVSETAQDLVSGMVRDMLQAPGE